MQAETTPKATAPERPLAPRIRAIAYWICTVAVTWEMVAGGLWDFFQIEYVRVILAHLGYPSYIDLILGPCKLAGAIVVFLPGFPRLKEWAYAGFVFNYYGAVASHVLAGDGPARWAPPLLLLLLTIGSWALRPADRRLPRDPSPTRPSRLAWAIPAGVIIAMLAASYLGLPRGAPPGY